MSKILRPGIHGAGMVGVGMAGGGALGLPPLDFDLGQIAFTAGMAKRIGNGPFAAAPIVQGMWDGTGTPDVLSFVRGNVVASDWYDNFDPYQGGGFCDWTPEQATGDRADDGYIWYVSADYYLLYDYTNDRYELGIGGQTMTVAAVLVAGTMEILAWGFDTNNDLDGTNYAYLSRNNVQTYSMAVQPTASAPGGTVYVGSNGTADPSNAIPEGLVFVREIPWTGAFGTDMGEGDIVAAHYAAGAGADASLSIGSWGTLFSLPTDSAPGALTTGTGEAWSHPHSSVVLTDSWCETTYGASAWGDEGTPSAGPADMAAAGQIFNWGYDWTCDAANEGITQTVATAAGANYVIRVIAHCVSANDIRVRIWDETNGEQMRGTADFDFGASSSRTQPGVALFCFEAATIARNGAAADCISFSVKVMGVANTQEVFCHQVELQANLVDNPSLETGAGNPWIPDGWNNNGLDAGDTQASSTGGAIIHSGVDCIQFNAGAIPGEEISFFTGGPVGTFFCLALWAYNDAGMDSPTNGHNFQYAFATGFSRSGSGATWLHLPAVTRGGASSRINVFGASAAGRYVDDVYAFRLDAVSLTATPANEANSLESAGIRVDGRDTCIQPVAPAGILAGTSGWIRWTWRPRHDAANILDFDEGGALFFSAWGVLNYITVRALAANTIRMQFDDGGGAAVGDWACAGQVVADTNYLMEIRYTGAWVRLYQDGVQRAEIVAAVDFAADIPTALYWGSRDIGDLQGDSVYANV